MLKLVQTVLLPLLGGALLLALLVALLSEPRTQRESMLDATERCIEDTTANEFSAATFDALLAEPFHEPATTCWQQVSLPDISLPEPVVNMDQPQTLRRVWFRFRLASQALPPNSGMQLYLPRVVGGAWQAWANGRALDDDRDNWRQLWNDPALIEIPAALLDQRPLDLRIAITFHPQLGYTLSRAYVGTPTALRPRIAWRNFLQDTAPKASTLVLLSIGTLFFIFWWARRQETTHLLLPLAGIAWSVCNLQYVLHRPADDVLHDWYDAIITLSITWVMYLIYLFTLRLEAQRSRVLEYFLPAFVIFMTLIELPIWPWRVEFDILFQICNLAMGLTVTGFIGLRAWQSRRIELIAITVTLAVAIGCAVHDVALYAQFADPEHVYLLPFNTVTVYGAMLFALLCRYVRAINAGESYSAELQRQLHEQSIELENQYARVREVEKQQVLLSERQRLMHDMHDGLGSALMSTLVAVERGHMPQSDVAVVLRACIEDLRLVIDSLEPLGHDLELLLATMRHRLGQRLQAAGLTLHWRVDDLPKLPWMESPQALQVMRTLQEILTNIVKHAQASTVHITAHYDGDGHAVIVIEDNGIGFDPHLAQTGRGLKHLLARSEALGITLLIHSVPHVGTQVSLRLPTARSP